MNRDKFGRAALSSSSARLFGAISSILDTTRSKLYVQDYMLCTYVLILSFHLIWTPPYALWYKLGAPAGVTQGEGQRKCNLAPLFFWYLSQCESPKGFVRPFPSSNFPSFFVYHTREIASSTPGYSIVWEKYYSVHRSNGLHSRIKSVLSVGCAISMSKCFAGVSPSATFFGYASSAKNHLVRLRCPQRS